MMGAELRHDCDMDGAACDVAVTCIGYTGKQIDRKHDSYCTQDRAEEVQTWPEMPN